MKDIKLFANSKIKPVRTKPLKLNTTKLVKTGVELALLGAAVGIGLGAYKTVTN